MHQNVFSIAEANDVPHDEEITGKIEFFDEVQFTIDLFPGTLAQIPPLLAITPAHAFARSIAQKRDHRLAFWNWILWEFVAKILQRELQAT